MTDRTEAGESRPLGHASKQNPFDGRPINVVADTPHASSPSTVQPDPDLCPFCERIERAEYEPLTPSVVAFEPLNPVVPGHLLVVPLRHVSDAAQDPDTAAATMRAAAEVVGQRYQHANIITSRGSDATQSVYHLHLHIVPRTEGDGLALPWAAGSLSAGPLDGTANAAFLNSDLYDHLAAMHYIAHGRSCEMCAARLGSPSAGGSEE